MIRNEAEQETVFADLKIGEQFQIVKNGSTFRKQDERSAKLSVARDGTEIKWTGAKFHFGRQAPVTRA